MSGKQEVDFKVIGTEVTAMLSAMAKGKTLAQQVATSTKTVFKTEIAVIDAISAGWVKPEGDGERRILDLHAGLTHFAQGLAILLPAKETGNVGGNATNPEVVTTGTPTPPAE